MDRSPPGSPVPGILQARTQEWVAISFSNAWKWKVKVKSLSCVWLLVTPWNAAHQAPLSTGFSSQEYWSGVSLPSPVPKFRFLQISSGEKTYVSIIFICARPLSFDFAYSGLYAGQEATVRTGQGTTDWFQIGKGVRQGCILSPCLFNLYAEYIMRNTSWKKHKLESRLPGEISITSDMQMTPPLWQKVKRN